MPPAEDPISPRSPSPEIFMNSPLHTPTRRCSNRTLVTGLLAVVALSHPFSAIAASVEERLEQLEQKVSTLTQENLVLKKQLGYDAKGKPGAALVTAQGKETKLALGGFLHLQAEAGDAADSRFPANDRFLMRKVRLGARGSFSDVFDFSLTADIGANSLGSASAYRAQGTDIFVVWKAHPSANVTVGQFKTPYSAEYLVGDPKTVTVERSLANDLLALGRQAGAMVSGTFLDKKLTYGVALVNGNGANNSFNDNDDFTYVGRLAGAVLDQQGFKLTLGANAFQGEDSGNFTGQRTGTGVDAVLTFNRAEIAAEMLRTEFDRATGIDYEARGWMLQGTYFLVPNRWQAVARYETYDPSDVAGADDTELITVGFNYLFKGDDLKLSLNYLIGDPPGSNGHQNRLLARLQVIY